MTRRRKAKESEENTGVAGRIEKPESMAFPLPGVSDSSCLAIRPASGQTGRALRKRAEDVVREKEALSREQLEALSRENLEVLSPQETRQTLHELRVRQIELEMQNDELSRAQVELDDARARYFDLYDLAPVGYCTLSEMGVILEANLTAATLLGVVRGAMVKQPINRFILKADQDVCHLHRKQLFETGTPQVWELRMVNSDGTVFWAHLATSLGNDSEGVPVCRIVISDVTERKRSEEELRQSLEEKEVLLREVHHRVKNNLTVISSLLNLQSSAIHTPEQAMTAFQNSRDRSMSMALVHQKLYEFRNYARIDMGEYLRDLGSHLMVAYSSEGHVHLGTEAGEIILGVDSAIPCGLILNELITNALKHAFPSDRAGGIQVLLRTVDDESYALSVVDNGIGLSEGFAGRETLGLELVRMLTKQLGGTLEIFAQNGTHCEIRFPRHGATRKR